MTCSVPPGKVRQSISQAGALCFITAPPLLVSSLGKSTHSGQSPYIPCIVAFVNMPHISQLECVIHFPSRSLQYSFLCIVSCFLSYFLSCRYCLLVFNMISTLTSSHVSPDPGRENILCQRHQGIGSRMKCSALQPVLQHAWGLSLTPTSLA